MKRPRCAECRAATGLHAQIAIGTAACTTAGGKRKGTGRERRGCTTATRHVALSLHTGGTVTAVACCVRAVLAVAACAFWAGCAVSGRASKLRASPARHAGMCCPRFTPTPPLTHQPALAAPSTQLLSLCMLQGMALC
eukprot:scaffold54606_cov20-Tisochrysis_lutea.AAC.1